jgi:hypothetical protein
VERPLFLFGAQSGNYFVLPKRTKTTLSLSPTGKNAVQRKDRVLRLEKKLLLHSFFRIYWRGKLMQISIEND